MLSQKRLIAMKSQNIFRFVLSKITCMSIILPKNVPKPEVTLGIAFTIANIAPRVYSKAKSLTSGRF